MNLDGETRSWDYDRFLREQEALARELDRMLTDGEREAAELSWTLWAESWAWQKAAEDDLSDD